MTEGPLSSCVSGTAPCDAPGGVTVTAQAGSNLVAWSAAGAAVTYKVYRADGACPGSGDALLASGISGLSYADSTAVPGQIYSYTVSSVCAGGEGAVGSCVDVLTLSANAWSAVAWSADLGLFAAVASSGITGKRVMTSPDGINWTLRATPVDNNWTAICWSHDIGLFCAVSKTGTGNRVMTSPDGINWTIRSSAADELWVGIDWSPALGMFAAVADGGPSPGTFVMTSTDGSSWTAVTVPNGAGSIAWSTTQALFIAAAPDALVSSGRRDMDGACDSSFQHRPVHRLKSRRQ